MENNNNNITEEFEDALSLCDFALYDDQEAETNISYQHPNADSSTQDDLFEFSTSSSLSEPNFVKDIDRIIFCGKIMAGKSGGGDHENEQKYSGPVSSFFSSSSTPLLYKSKTRSDSSYSKRPQARRSSSSKNRHQVIIGLAKIPSKMELSDLRERQNRKQTLPPMFPALVGGDALAVSGDGSRRRNRSCGVLHGMATMLTRSSSFGCLRMARPCID